MASLLSRTSGQLLALANFVPCPAVGMALPRSRLLARTTRVAFVKQSRLPLDTGDFMLMFKPNDDILAWHLSTKTR